MSKKKLIDALNADRADELAAILQYLGHHYLGEGMESPEIVELFKSTAVAEMKHAEALAERIAYLGGDPTTKPSAVKKGGSLKKMIQDDLAAENTAIRNYKAHVKLADSLGDSTTRRLLEGILSDEEGHANDWESVLAIRKK